VKKPVLRPLFLYTRGLRGDSDLEQNKYEGTSVMAMNRGRCVQRRAWAIYLELLLLWVGSYSGVRAQKTSAHSREKTYCNPVNLSYRFQLQPPSRREAADPTMVVYKKQYWLFPSKSGGYWHSSDLLRWSFVASSGGSCISPRETFPHCM